MDENILLSIEDEINKEYNSFIELNQKEYEEREKEKEKKKKANRRYANKARLKRIAKYKKLEEDNIVLKKVNLSLKTELEILKKKIKRKNRKIKLLKKKKKKKNIFK